MIDRNANYRILIQYTRNDGAVLGSPGDIKLFREWAKILYGRFPDAESRLERDLSYYDGSSAARPQWFEQVTDSNLPVDGQYHVSAPVVGLPNARVAGNTANIEVDNSLPGQVLWDLTETGVTPGAYTSANVTVDEFGRVIAISNGGGGGGGGDVVGPASATNNNVPQWDGTTGKLLKDGLGVSQGGNGAADANKLVQFKSDGGIEAATGLLAGPALYGETGALNQPGVQGYSTNGGEGGRFQSVGGDGVSGSSDSGAGLRGTSATGPGVHANVTDATNVADLALFHRDDNLGLEVRNNGALDWTTSDGASDTLTNLGATTPGAAILTAASTDAQRLLLGRILKKITTQTTGVSTSYTDVTDMSFSVVAGTTYSFTFVVLAESSSTSGGVCLTANGPAATYFAARYEGNQTAGGSIIRSDITAYDSSGTLADPNSVTAANTPYVFTLQGVIVPSANGTFSLRVKRGGSAGNIAVRAGSMDVIVM